MAANNEWNEVNRKERQDHYVCSCGDGFSAQQFAIQCDHCKEWFHGFCVHLQEFEAEEIEKFFCIGCEGRVGPSVAKAVTNDHRHNRTELNPTLKPTQSGTVRFVNNLKSLAFLDAKSNESVIKKMRGQQMTIKELLVNGFDIPILVETKDGLELTVPSVEAFSFDSVLKYYSSDYMLDVIDVRRQLNIKMKTKDFVNHLKTPLNERNNVYNCISLEVSNTALSEEVRPPNIVNKLSWVESYWPKVEMRPAVSKYCLISMQNSFTDFHIDFGGTSVWYHVLKGEKIFYIIKPTKENLEQYEKWMTSSHSSEKFFADSIDECFKLNLTAGQTLFIPTGWIHAVLTPKDSIVFGGNFLHSLNIELQLQIREMEQRIKTPDKFQFPFFELTNWYAAPNVHVLLDESLKKNPPKHLVNGVTALIPQLRLWYKKSKDNQNDYQSCTLAPRGFNCVKVIKDLNMTLKKAIRKLEGQPIVKKRGKSYKSFNLESNVRSPLTLVETTAKSSDKKNGSQKRPKSNDNEKESHLDIDDERSLVVDDSSKAVNKRLRTSSTESESKGSLKLKLSFSKKILSPEATETSPNIDSYDFDLSNNEDKEQFLHRLPALKSSLDLNSPKKQKTSLDLNSPKKQKTIKGKRKKVSKEKQLEEEKEIESMVKGRPEDKDYIYLDLETPEDEEFKNRSKSNNKDESWSPKAKVTIKATPKPPRPPRDNAKRDVVESTIANAAAKMENMPQQKRAYNRKKPKQPKATNITELSAMNPIIDSQMSPTVSSTFLNTINPIMESQISPSVSTNANPPLSSPAKPSLSLNTTNTTQMNKKPKKGLATPKQRMMKKMKMNLNKGMHKF